MRNIVIAIAIGVGVAIAGTLFYYFGWDKAQPKSNEAQETQKEEAAKPKDVDVTASATWSNYETNINGRQLYVSRIGLQYSGTPGVFNAVRIIPKPSETPHYAQASINGGEFRKDWSCEIQKDSVLCQGEKKIQPQPGSFFDIYYLVGFPPTQQVKVELLNDEEKIAEVVASNVDSSKQSDTKEEN